LEGFSGLMNKIEKISIMELGNFRIDKQDWKILIIGLGIFKINILDCLNDLV
jgi:hypothetical protein